MENRRALAIAQTLTHVWALPRSITLDWSYAALDKRDLRLDLLRGFAVMVMVIDHFGGSSWLYLITGGNNFFVSGAEAFVFISGFVVGMVYGGIALKQGLKTAADQSAPACTDIIQTHGDTDTALRRPVTFLRAGVGEGAQHREHAPVRG